MIPYFEWHVILLGPIPIQVWGLFVALGIVVATALLSHILKRDGVNPPRPPFDKGGSNLAWDLAFVAMIGAIVGARLGHVFFYDWDFYRTHLPEIVAVWKGGLSSYGGFVGGAGAALVWLWMKGAPLLRVTDATLAALPLGWCIGRIGCFLIHDHPGTLTNSPFGVQFPGGSRFDLGMIDGLIGLFVFAVVFPLHRVIGKKFPGVTTAVAIQLYAVLRFITDFLRATDLPNSDPRIYGFTPAQYASGILFLIGDVLILRAVFAYKKRNLASGPQP
ncbi:MAG: prolipoprotein diacylglyceryl transferase [Patescibacteria group bacterium]